MARLHGGRQAHLFLVISISFLLLLPGCGKSKPAPPSGIPAKITLTPATSYSIQAGTTVFLTASAQNSSNGTIAAVFNFVSSDPSVLDIAPSGFACAGSWNAPAYTICTPGSSSATPVTVYAEAGGVTSPPTLFFVHPPIASIQVSLVPNVNSPPPACPNPTELPAACNIPFNTGNCTTRHHRGVSYVSCTCLSQGQTETLQAAALDSQGNDITASVGPFTWTPANTNVVKITPIVTITSYNVPTNQATLSPETPGQTQIIASASGAFSQSYEYETCPVQCIDLELQVSGVQSSSATNFVVNKGTSESITAFAVDVQGCLVPKPSLTWISSEPSALTVAATCNTGTTCAASSPQPGAAAITATCTPPTCNVGFPLNPSGFPAGSIYIPQPVYPVSAISGIVTGAPSTTSVLATSQDCSSDELCSVALYSVSTSNNLPGGAIQLPTPPNSLLFDGGGDKAYVGSAFGAVTMNPSSLGTSSGAFTALFIPGTPSGLVTGKVLAVSPSGSSAIFSDTVSTPNQVYVVGTTPSTTPLNINSAIAAAFSPDSLRAFILGNGGTSLYAFSPLQFLQEPAPTLPSPATSIVFNSNGSFALLAGGASPSTLAIYKTLDNSSVSLSSGTITTPPLFLIMVPGGNVPLGGVFGNTVIPFLETTGLDFFFGLDNSGIDVIATNTSGPLSPPCPALQSTNQIVIAYTSPTAPAPEVPCTPFPPFHINIGVGTFNPINFFVTPSATQAYIVTSDRGVLIYNFSTASVANIPLINNAVPVAASFSVDGSLISVAGSDGLLHQLNTALLSDEFQTSFPPVVNSISSFCFTANSCALNMVAVKP